MKWAISNRLGRDWSPQCRVSEGLELNAPDHAAAGAVVCIWRSIDRDTRARLIDRIIEVQTENWL